jgi:hypothetical protein
MDGCIMRFVHTHRMFIFSNWFIFTFLRLSEQVFLSTERFLSCMMRNL